MATPTHLAHKPITSVDDYSQHDGIYANNTDVESLSIGKAQYDGNEISAKVFRYTGNKWSRQSEELPLHRVIDLSTVILNSILLSGSIPLPPTNLNLNIINHDDLSMIVSYYKQHRDILLPKLQELQASLNYFIQEEPQLSMIINMELAGIKFVKKEIEQLPPDIANKIKDDTSDSILMIGQAYMRNQCHNNAILAANEIKSERAENRIVEGLVKCEDGFLFEHFWNRIVCGKESSDFDVTLDVIGSEEGKNTKKQYFEYKNYSLSEIEQRKSSTVNAFSSEIKKAITEYYKEHPLAERYYNFKKQID